MAKILVVEDEIPIAEGLVLNLQRKNHEVTHADTGQKALDLLNEKNFDLILLDVRLPEVDGFEVCQRLRRKKNYTPIIMLTARDQPDDKVFGLKSGADDYMTKPFDLAELFARVEGHLRRASWQEIQEADEFENNLWRFGDFWVDFTTWRAQTLLGEIELSKKEIEVLKVFRAKRGQVVSRRLLLEQVWGMPNHPNERIVDNVIVMLRKHFETNSQNPTHITNVRGEGYRFEEE